MSITKFTPGPWSLEPCELETRLGQPFCGKYYVKGPYCSDGRFDKADAHLIAAAPDLYTVLDAFLSDIDEHGEVGFTLRQRARALLNKIEGLTP